MLAARLADLERRIAASHVVGKVVQVDPAGGRVRLDLGEATGGGRLLSPWVRYAQTGGALKVHSPPTVGQQMAIASPGGDMAQGVASSVGFSDANPSPSGAGDQNVITFGAVTITLTGSGLTIAAGGTTVEISGAGLAVTGGDVTHDGTNIGATHVHPHGDPAGVTGGPQ